MYTSIHKPPVHKTQTQCSPTLKKRHQVFWAGFRKGQGTQDMIADACQILSQLLANNWESQRIAKRSQ